MGVLGRIPPWLGLCRKAWVLPHVVHRANSALGLFPGAQLACHVVSELAGDLDPARSRAPRGLAARWPALAKSGLEQVFFTTRASRQRPKQPEPRPGVGSRTGCGRSSSSLEDRPRGGLQRQPLWEGQRIRANHCCPPQPFHGVALQPTPGVVGSTLGTWPCPLCTLWQGREKLGWARRAFSGESVHLPYVWGTSK